MNLQIGVFNIHLYGVMIALAFMVGFFLIEKRAKKTPLSIDLVDLSIYALIFGILGARIYHLLTDFDLYQNHLLEIFYIWQGGLGIIGAVLGAMGGIYLFLKKQHRLADFKTLLDLSVFGLPFAQAIGRIGNYFNQELYGLPTDLPWAIYIDPAHRLSGFAQFSDYHPLFFYEGLLMIFAGLLVWYVDQKKFFVKKFKIGSGNLFVSYSVYYLLIRFLLEFIRLEKRIVFSVFSLNQLISILLIIFLVFLLKKNATK